MYISIDGNNIGKTLEKYILSEDIAGLEKFSKSLNDTINYFTDLINCQGGTIIVSGGDNILASFSDDSYKKIIAKVLRPDTVNVCFSVGIGKTAIHSYLALKYAKAMNHNMPVYYDGSIFHLRDESE